MPKTIIAALAAILFHGASIAPPQAPRAPRLVVVIVVDQMRADYLDRFASLYHGGLARLTHEGTVFAEAHHDHADTETSPGHATISTGTFPSHSGIIANNWYDAGDRRVVYSVDDSSVTISSHPRDPGRSPHRLLTETLGDWVKKASPQSKIFSVSIKDRAAILMAGHKADGVFWYNTKDGHYESSSYYAAQPPAWVDSFNLANPADRHLKEGWTLARSPEVYSAQGPDSVFAEGDGVHVTFPHALDPQVTGSAAASYAELPYTPFGDELTLSFARTAVVHEGLGADAIPDILWISCSSGDYVGHRYGPDSWEIEDYYLRLDEYLGDFLGFLDQQVGAGNYVVALTADHGGMPLPEVLAAKGVKARRVLRSEASAAFQKVEDAVVKDLGISRPLFAGYLEGFMLHASSASGRQISRAELERRVAVEMRKVPFVADVYTESELAAGTDVKRPYFEQFQHSFYPGRSPDISIRYQPNVLLTESNSPHGTSHGTPYEYDSHVPLVFFGAGVKASHREEKVRTVDISPTLSRMIDIAPPSTVDGHVLPRLR
jgi:predicted AlkP superfamily pyrophosphatase or phosphodiesterase